MRRLIVGGLIAAGLVAVPSQAPAAEAAEALTTAGSIVFIKDHDVWVSSPDGSAQRALTTSGTSSLPWRSPDQSDVGTVVATRGNLIYRMNQWGTELNVIDPPNLRSSANEWLGGPVKSTTISPDGSKITYTYEKFSCPAGGPPTPPCRLRWVTGISAATHLTSPTQYGVAFYDHPTWLTNSRLLLNGIGFDQIYLFDLGRGDLFWYHEGMFPGSDFKALADGAVSRSGTLMSVVRGEFEDSRILTYTLSRSPREGTVPPLPTPVCETSPSDGLASPTFAPDSTAVAWEEPDGVWIKDAPASCGVQQTLVLPGGSAPSWSAAALQTTRPGPIAFRLLTKPKISGTAKAGRTLRVSKGTWSSTPSSTTYRWYRNGRSIGGATKSSYRVRSKDKRKRLAVKVTVRKPGHATTSVTTRSVRVRR